MNSSEHNQPEAEPFLVVNSTKSHNQINREDSSNTDIKWSLTQEIPKIVIQQEIITYKAKAKSLNSEKFIIETQEKLSPKSHRFTGIALALLSCMGFSASSLIIKYLKEYDPFTKSVWRFQGLVLPAIPMMLCSRYLHKEPVFDTIYPPCQYDSRKNILFLLLRSTAALSSLIIQFYSLQYIALADQMVIGSSQPVFVSIVAYFLLGEKCGFIPVFNCLLTIIGMGIVAKPPMLTGLESFDKDLLIGSGLALASTGMSVISIIFTRKLKHIHFTITAFTFGLFSIIVSLSASLALKTFQLPKNENHLLIAILLAIFVFITQTSTIVALKYEQAGPVSLVKTSSVVFAFLWQYLFLDIIPDVFSLLGAVIIVVAVILTTLRKWVATLPESDTNRRFYSFLLK